MKTLISAAELLEQLRCARPPSVLDCGFELVDPAAGERAWREGHLPGALYLHLDRDLAGAKQDAAGRLRGRHPLPERAS
jgi:thiosulfate/3-mercaptopyruvate sulfurtransferase